MSARARSFASGVAPLAVLLCFGAALAATPAPVPVDDIVLRAMGDELARSMAQLRLEQMQRPFYIEYAVLDSQVVDVRASFGAVVRETERHSRPLRVDVRVGDYAFDNSEFVGARFYRMTASGLADLVLDDDYSALRRDVWLATDDAYKQALEQFARKEAFAKTKLQTEQPPDFSKETPVTRIGPKAGSPAAPQRWSDLARRLSGVFRDFRDIASSEIRVRESATTRYFVNSEGAVGRQAATLVSVVAFARTQATDGMALRRSVVFHAPAADRLPAEKDMEQAIRGMAAELTAQRNAPVLEQYIGPVLVTGQAAAEFFAQGFAPHLSGDRPPLYEEERMAASAWKSELADRLNRRVLPPFLSVSDDPGRTEFDGKALIGGYSLDDQGQPARAATLVDRGVLRGLVMSRRPRKELAQSNGHARAMGGGAPRAMISNLLVEAQGGKTYDELKRELLDMCRAQELTHGLIIRVLETPESAGDDSSVAATMFGRGGDRSALGAPIVVRRVSVADGSEELVRGLSFGEFGVRSFKDIVAAGADPVAQNRLTVPSAGPGVGYFYSMGGAGGLSGAPTAVIAPSLLFEELELRQTAAPAQKPPLLPHPAFQ